MSVGRVLIFCGGRIGKWAIDEIRDGDQLIGADRGALFLIEHGRTPDYALGDFDSVSAEERERVRAMSRHFADFDPVYKDWTDTELAFRKALELHPEQIVLLGALGTRFDHSLANVHLLRVGLDAGVLCRIVDDRNRIALMDRELVIRRSGFANVSLLPLSAEVTGITLTGFRYPLERATLQIGQSIGISNVLDAMEGRVAIESGLLLVIEAKD